MLSQGHSDKIGMPLRLKAGRPQGAAPEPGNYQRPEKYLIALLARLIHKKFRLRLM